MSSTLTGPAAIVRLHARRLTMGDRATTFLTAVLAVLVIAAVAAPLLAPDNPNATNLLSANLGPSLHHPFGTDSLGRDVFSRVLYGTRLSLLGPALVVAAAVIVGTAAAVVGAWLGGWVDALVARAIDLLSAVPGLLLALVAVTIMGPGLTAPVIAMAVAYSPYIARVVRSVAIREASMPYIESYRLLGLAPWRICSFHLIRNIIPVARAQATLSYGAALLDLAALSYLGLGVQPPTPEWGLMVSDGQSALLNGHPQETLFSGLMIVITVVVVNLLGERMSIKSRSLL